MCIAEERRKALVSVVIVAGTDRTATTMKMLESSVTCHSFKDIRYGMLQPKVVYTGCLIYDLILNPICSFQYSGGRSKTVVALLDLYFH